MEGDEAAPGHSRARKAESRKDRAATAGPRGRQRPVQRTLPFHDPPDSAFPDRLPSGGRHGEWQNRASRLVPAFEHLRRFSVRATIWSVALLLLVSIGEADESAAQLFQPWGSTPPPKAPRQVGMPVGPDVSANYPDITSQPCPNYPFTQSALCGAQHGGLRCRSGYCCSAWGYCGNDTEWCEYSYGLPCQLGYGRCWFNVTVTCRDGPTLEPQTRTTSGTATASPTLTSVESTSSTQTISSETETTGTTMRPTLTSSELATSTEASSLVPSSSTGSAATLSPSETTTMATITTGTRTVSSMTTTTGGFPSDWVDPACSPYYDTTSGTVKPTATANPAEASHAAAPIGRLLFARQESQSQLPPPDACILPTPPSRDQLSAQTIADKYGTLSVIGAGVVGGAMLVAWLGGEIGTRMKLS